MDTARCDDRGKKVEGALLEDCVGSPLVRVIDGLKISGHQLEKKVRLEQILLYNRLPVEDKVFKKN